MLFCTGSPSGAPELLCVAELAGSAKLSLDSGVCAFAFKEHNSFVKKARLLYQETKLQMQRSLQVCLLHEQPIRKADECNHKLDEKGEREGRSRLRPVPPSCDSEIDHWTTSHGVEGMSDGLRDVYGGYRQADKARLLNLFRKFRLRRTFISSGFAAGASMTLPVDLAGKQTEQRRQKDLAILPN